MNPLKFALASLFAATLFTSASQAEDPTRPQPRDREFSWMPLSEWYQKHADDVAVAAKGEAEIVFVGDSITQGYEWAPSWEREFDKYKPANLAIGGDKTQNLLWRLQHGATGKLDPKLVVMMIGVNNFLHDDTSAQETFAGVKANLAQLKTSFPKAKILVIGVMPYGESSDDPNRERVKAVNEMIATLEGGDVSVFDIGKVFLEDDGSISKEIMADFLHPTNEGYERMTEALLPKINELMAAE